jgi:hypothetical protein
MNDQRNGKDAACRSAPSKKSVKKAEERVHVEGLLGSVPSP